MAPGQRTTARAGMVALTAMYDVVPTKVSAIELTKLPLTPKSHSLASPDALIRMLDGLMSRWITSSCSFRVWRPLTTCARGGRRTSRQAQFSPVHRVAQVPCACRRARRPQAVTWQSRLKRRLRTRRIVRAIHERATGHRPLTILQTSLQMGSGKRPTRFKTWSKEPAS